MDRCWELQLCLLAFLCAISILQWYSTSNTDQCSISSWMGHTTSFLNISSPSGMQWLQCVQQLHTGILWGFGLVQSELHICQQLWSVWATVGKRYKYLSPSKISPPPFFDWSCCKGFFSLGRTPTYLSCGTYCYIKEEAPKEQYCMCKRRD